MDRTNEFSYVRTFLVEYRFFRLTELIFAVVKHGLAVVAVDWRNIASLFEDL